MLTRRDLVQLGAATAALGVAGSTRALAQQRLTQAELLRFEPVGQVTLLHFADLHAQLLPLHFREPSVNIGVGEAAGMAPHLVGQHFIDTFHVAPDSAQQYALTAVDFTALARSYGRIGGLDRLATVVKAIRAERPGRVLLLDGGDTWQGSYTSSVTRGADMVRVMKALEVDAMTAHWEFTYGAERVKELVGQLDFAFLAGNVKDTGFGDAVFDGETIIERGGLKIGLIGQAFPYTPIANPRWLVPEWSFGIEEDRLRARVAKLRAANVDLVVVLSHNGFDVDRKLARRVDGIDVILTGHTHDAIPMPVSERNGTLLIASGSHGKFLSRLDLVVKDRKVVDLRYRLIPLFADVIAPDPEMAALVKEIRAPHEAVLGTVLARTESLLYRRGNFNGTFDDVICQALLKQRDAEIALSPGFRWGASLLPGQDITVEDVHNQTAITYPAAYRTTMKGSFLREILEDVADNLFNPDPYLQQGGDMVRVGGMAYAIDVAKPIGRRISDMTLLRTGERIDPDKSYTVAGWASVNENTEGPPIHQVVGDYLSAAKTIRIEENRHVRVSGADPRGVMG